MRLLQAAMKDAAARRARDSRHCYRVGSYMKGCANCGDTEEVETKSGGVVVRYTSGFNVYRSYQPSATKWTWICEDCGAKDLACWAPDGAGTVELQLGRDAIRGTRDAMAAAKKQLRKEAERKYGLRKEKLAVGPPDDRVLKILELERQLVELKAKVKGE